jgi:hypothetical protein
MPRDAPFQHTPIACQVTHAQTTLKIMTSLMMASADLGTSNSRTMIEYYSNTRVLLLLLLLLLLVLLLLQSSSTSTSIV